MPSTSALILKPAWSMAECLLIWAASETGTVCRGYMLFSFAHANTTRYLHNATSKAVNRGADNLSLSRQMQVKFRLDE
jgi:hypothetical protein